MEAVELKSNIHQIVDAIQNQQVLQTLYDFLKPKENEKNTFIWDSLNEEQKQELLLAYGESENQENLVDATVIFKNLE